jgi:hypothetical protein
MRAAVRGAHPQREVDYRQLGACEMIDLSRKDSILTRWSLSESRTRQMALRWALELAEKANPGDSLESISKVAARHNVSESMATSARILLMGLGIIGSRNGHFYVIEPKDG